MTIKFNTEEEYFDYCAKCATLGIPATFDVNTFTVTIKYEDILN